MKRIILYLLITVKFSFAQITDTIDLKTFLSQKIDAVAVETKGGILHITGYQSANFVSKDVLLARNDVFVISKLKFAPTLSLLTIPIKVRGKQDTIPQNVQTGLTNIGISVNLLNYKKTKFFSSGKQAVHIISAGVLLAPTVEELTPENTKKMLTKKSKQMFFSAGLNITYTYNDISFSFVPIGIDIPTTLDGKKYIYKNKRWWGFGVGITTKLFGLF